MTIIAGYLWVSQLARRYEQAVAVNGNTTAALLEQLPTLQVASAALQKVALDNEYPDHVKHIAVLGPTQSGKSTIVNVVLDTHAASASALAGFTVHTQGYASTVNASDAQYVNSMMAPLQRTAANTLTSDRLDCYVLEQVGTGKNSMVGNAIVWDTPDFDSISANSYSLAVLKTTALSDVAMVVVSKDKYGDKRVWDMLALLKSLGKPLLVCINKLDDADRAVVENAFITRYRELFGEPVPTLVVLPFVRHDASTQSLLSEIQITQHLQEALHLMDANSDSSDLISHCQQFIRQHEAQWLEPLVTEVNAREHWMQMIQRSIDEAEEYYANNYLDNPDKYETFNRTLAELLTLLEIPGVAPALAQARKLITWPARKLLGVGRNALGRVSDQQRNASGQVTDQEAMVLEQILDTTLVRLQRELLEISGEPWWHTLNSHLRDELPAIRGRYLLASEQARREFEPEIEKAAASLYEQLKEQPALLNTLRAARASADAAGIALAVKSGGLAPTDLILAPAMLSVTTLLTESALGRYLDSVKRNLKKRQREHIKTRLLEKTLASELRNMTTQLDSADVLSHDLEADLKKRLEEYRGKH
ncbi:MAG: GTPase domain-containing protein [Granulosicoccus sp.]